MAVITIPSSFSPIAAALDVFTQDRLAQQKRARQAEQDAWNREARNRQRQGWGRQDEIQRRQDLLWQEQRAAYAQANAEKQRLAQQHQDALGRYNENTLGTALGQETPAFTDTEMGGDWNEMAGETATTPGLREVLEANMSARAKYGNLWGMPSRAELISRMQGKQEFDQEALREAIFTFKNSEPGSVSRSMAYLALKKMGLGVDHINEIAGPEVAAQFGIQDYGQLNQIARGDDMYTGTNVPMGDEDAKYDDPDVAVKPTELQRLQAMRARDELVGRKTTQSDLDSIFNPRAEKPAETVPFSHWQKAFGHSGGQVQTGDVMSGIETVMKEALMDNLKSSDHAQPFKMSELFSATQEEELMSNMWQAAQMIQRQYFPMKTPQTVFQEMKRAIGTGPDELDLIDTTGTMAGYEKTSLGHDDYLARYLHTPRIYNTQQIIQDYLETLGHKDLTNQLDEIRKRHN